jgi:hypothetical protein
MRTAPTTRRRAAVLLVPLLLGVAGCGDDGDEEEPQLPNPAASFCIDQGGESKIVTDADGSQRGICVLPDGTEVEEWAYYRQFHDESGNTLVPFGS